MTRSTAKSSAQWTPKDLLAFNIQVIDADTPAFFGTTLDQLPSPPQVSSTILNNEELRLEEWSEKGDMLFFAYLENLEDPDYKGDPIGDFVSFLLSYLDYDVAGRFVYQRAHFYFMMDGERVSARANVCVMNNNYDYLLIVQEEKLKGALSKNIEPRIIAEAIAVAYDNNLRRISKGQPELGCQYIPAIKIVGSAPIFYLIPITTSLLSSLNAATYPQEETRVLKYTPPVPDPTTYSKLGMRPLVNRRIVMQCFEAFKSFMLSADSVLRATI